MKLMSKGVSVGLTALLATGGVLLTGGAAYAGPSTSPFDPPVLQTSTNNNGALDTLEFYNAAGARIFGGAIATPPKFIKATNYTGRTSADTLATTFIATPVKGSAAVTWQTQQVSAGDAYRTAAVTGQASDGKALNSSTFSWLLPADINILNVNADPAWADLYQIRLSTSGPGAGIDFTKFPSATVSVDNAAGTWKQIFPAQVAQATTTIVTASPASPTNAGTSVTLSAAVAPAAAAGSVEFKDGATSLGTSPVSGGTASLAPQSFAAGTHSLSAIFTPTDPAAFSGSTGTLSYVSNTAPAAPTTTDLSVSPTTGPAFSSVALHSNVRGAGTALLASGAGVVRFFDGANPIGQASLTATGADLTVATLAPGAHTLTATFTPTDPAVYNGSTSPPVTATYGPAAGPAPDPQTVTTTVPVGALTISTPYHAANPFDLGNMVLNPTGTRFEASARFPKLADPQIHITDTRAGQLGWTAYVTATNFAGPGTAAINAQNLALTGVTAVYTPGDALQAPAVSTFDVLSTAGTVYAPAASGTDGFAGPPAKKFASTSAGASVGTVNVFGQLTLKAPASTPAGLYTSTVTFTIS